MFGNGNDCLEPGARQNMPHARFLPFFEVSRHFSKSSAKIFARSAREKLVRAWTWPLAWLVCEEKRQCKFSGFILQCYDRQLEQWSNIFGASSIVDIICIFFMMQGSFHRRHKSVGGDSSISSCSRQRSYFPHLRHMGIVEALLHGKEEQRL